MKTLLFLDIDGVLNPWAAPACPPGYAEHRWRARKAWLSPAHGTALLALAGHVDLVWASSWAEDANTLVGKALGCRRCRPSPFTGPHADTGRDWKFTAVGRVRPRAAARLVRRRRRPAARGQGTVPPPS